MEKVASSCRRCCWWAVRLKVPGQRRWSIAIPKLSRFTTAVTPGFEAWLVKFPAKEEHAEVCAIEMVYAECLRMCGIETPDTQYFSLPNG